jgi:hypothetical protein
MVWALGVAIVLGQIIAGVTGTIRLWPFSPVSMYAHSGAATVTTASGDSLVAVTDSGAEVMVAALLGKQRHDTLLRVLPADYRDQPQLAAAMLPVARYVADESHRAGAGAVRGLRLYRYTFDLAAGRSARALIGERAVP